MKKTVIYARYSSSSQNEQSIEGQLRVCKEYAARNDLVIVGEYLDRAISGRTDDRPEFQRMMKDSSRKIFDAVLIYKTDRFARNKYDSAIHKSKLRDLGIELHYAAESIPDGPEGIILESLMEGLAEYYSAELSQKIKRGNRESALKGKIMGNHVPLGYKRTSDRKYAIDETNAEAVRIIFDLYVQRQAVSDISKHLNDRGFRTSYGRPFTKNSIPRIIANEKYVGIYKYQDIIVEDAIPPIITAEVFKAAQQETQRRSKTRQTKSSRADYALSGKLFCGHCGSKMTGACGTGKKNTYHYYVCPKARFKNGCKKTPVAKNYIEELVVAETVEHILKPETIKHISKACYDISLREADKNDDKDALYRRRLNENQKAINNILKAIESGISTHTLPERLSELENERSVIQAEKALAKESALPLSQEHIEFMLLQYTRGGCSNDEYKKNIIKSFVLRVNVFDNKLEVYYNISEHSLNASELNIRLDKSDCSSDGASAPYYVFFQIFHSSRNCGKETKTCHY